MALPKHHSEFTPEEQTNIVNSFITPRYQPKQETKVVILLDGEVVKLGGRTYSHSTTYSRHIFITQLAYAMSSRVFQREEDLPAVDRLVNYAGFLVGSYNHLTILKRKAKQWITQMEKQGRIIYQPVQITTP